MARYDASDLQRRIAVSFSAGELSRFAERLGVMLDREGNPTDGARMLVRAMESRGHLDRLVEGLVNAKPLVEWPEPMPDVEEMPLEWLEPLEQSAPRHLDSPGSLGPPIPDPVAPVSDGGRQPPALPNLDDPYAGGDHKIGAEGPPWKWIALGAGVSALAIAAVLVVWRVTRDEQPTPDAPESLALLAADHLRANVDAVARACDAETTSSARERLADAFRRCTGPRIRPGLDLTPPLPKPSPPPADPVPQAPRPAGGGATREPPCLERCHEMQQQCQQSECGAEPRSAEKYTEYQKCLSECLSKYSRCRLSCR